MFITGIAGKIGKTPIVRLNDITHGMDSKIFAKIEYSNPGGSIKDRIALAIIDDAEKRGLLKPGGMIVEATSGNTGIALAMVSASFGYKLTLVMPDSMSIERRALINAYGAQIILTPAVEGMKGAVSRALKILDDFPGAFYTDQFSNPVNPLIHEVTTGPEIGRDMEGARIDAIILGVGTGGTITGVGRWAKKNAPQTKIIAVEPSDSPVLSGGNPGLHKIQGIGAGFIPEILDRSLIHEIIRVGNEEAFDFARKLARKEGIAAGISSGAAMAACMQYAKAEKNRRKRLNIVTVFPSNAERYISTDLFEKQT